jgi:hypothetical protein
MTQAGRTIGLVPRLRRSVIFGIGFPALPGWANVWRSALRAFGSVTFWRSALRAFASVTIFAVSFLPQLGAGKLRCS